MLEEAISTLRSGGIILIHDSGDRENEVDMVCASGHITPYTIRKMRSEAGGLICTTIPQYTAEKLGVPYYSELLEQSSILRGLSKNLPPYGSSAFGITINHISTRTGITDNDRAKTVSSISEIVSHSQDISQVQLMNEFTANFRSPGHVFLLHSHPSPLFRRGHTELSTAIVFMAGLTPSATICEMLSDNGLAMGLSNAEEYAEKNSLPIVDGESIIKMWKNLGMKAIV